MSTFLLACFSNCTRFQAEKDSAARHKRYAALPKKVVSGGHAVPPCKDVKLRGGRGSTVTIQLPFPTINQCTLQVGRETERKSINVRWQGTRVTDLQETTPGSGRDCWRILERSMCLRNIIIFNMTNESFGTTNCHLHTEFDVQNQDLVMQKTGVSEKTAVAHCGLDKPKYLSIWKGKLGTPQGIQRYRVHV